MDQNSPCARHRVDVGQLVMIPTGGATIMDKYKNTLVHFMLQFRSFLLFAQLEIKDRADMIADCLMLFGIKPYLGSTLTFHYR